MPLKIREIIIKEDHALVPLGNGQFSTIDLENVDFIGQWNWYMDDDGFAVREEMVDGEIKVIEMGRAIMDWFHDSDCMHAWTVETREDNFPKDIVCQNCNFTISFMEEEGEVDVESFSPPEEFKGDFKSSRSPRKFN